MSRRGMVALATTTLLLALAGSANAATPTWLPGEIIEPTAQATISGLSCPSPVTCLAAASNIPVVQDNGLSYEPAHDPDTRGVLTAVSCAPATRFCMFVDDSGGAFTYTNGTFGSRAQIGGNIGVESVSCRTGFCMAINDNNKVFKYANGAWDTGTQLPTGAHSFNMSLVNVSCASGLFCIALASTGDGELYYRWNGSTWSAPSAPFDAAGGHTISLSCTSTTFCLETDETGYASIFNGSGWSTPKRIDHPPGISFPVLYSACVGTNCLALDNYDNFIQTSDGQTWSTSVNIGSKTGMTGKGINSIACATATLCVAGDGAGDATTYAVPPHPGKPSVAGKPAVGQRLTLTHASVQTAPVWYYDDWFRCDNPDVTCTINPISTSTTGYTLVAADFGKYIDARETFGFGFDEEGFLAGGNLTSNIVGPVVRPPAVSGLSPRAGPTAGRNTVTITGANFVTGATVKFGAAGAALPTTFVSSTKLTVTAPVHAAGTVDVLVTTFSGGTSTATNRDLYAFGPPVVTAISPTGGPTAGGNTVTIDGSGFVPGATVKFGTTGSALSATFVSPAQLTVTAPPHAAGTVAVIVTTAGGTSAATNSDLYTYT